MPDYGGEAEDLARIRAEVEAGSTDLKALGFWRLLSKIKRDPALIEAFADQAAAIDRAAFERKFRVRLPVWLGNSVLLLATAALVALVAMAIEIPRTGSFWFIQTPDGDYDVLGLDARGTWPGILIVVAAGGLSVTVHDLAHWLWGRVAGIEFSSYFLDGPFRVQPGIKTEYASYLRADPRARARMHAAGAVASKVAPFAVFVPAYLVHRSHGYALFPSWSLWALLALGIVQILTDVVWSRKKSDWKRWRRERRIAADLYSKGTPGSSDVPG